MKTQVIKKLVNTTDVHACTTLLWSVSISNEKLVLPPKPKRPWLAATFTPGTIGGLYA